MSARISEIDYLRCVLILLMVAFHLVYIGDSYPYAKQVVYTFHMPGFLLISGYLANPRKPWGALGRKLWWVFVPYVVMEAGYTAMCSLLPVREHLDGLTLPVLLEKVFLHPLGPYWYLHTWMLCLLLQAVVWRGLRAGLFTRLTVFGLALWGLDACGLLSFSTAMYFLVGWAVAGAGFRFGEVFRPSWVAGLPLLVLCAYPSNLDRGCHHLLLPLLPDEDPRMVAPSGGALGLFRRAEHVARPVVLPRLHVRFQTLSSLLPLRADGDAVSRGIRGPRRGGQHRPGVGDGQAACVAVVLRQGEGGAVELVSYE